MALTDIINGAGGVRVMLTDIETVRFPTNDNFVRWGNDALREMALRRPDLFSVVDEITCTAGVTLQSLPAGALRIMDIFNVKDGRVVREVARASLDAFNSNWHNAAAGAAEQWMCHVKDPLRFFIYPKAPPGQVLIGQWGQTPDEIDIDDDIPLVGYDTVIKNYIIAAAESVQDEEANRARAMTHFALFETALNASTAAAKTTDQPEK